MIRKQIFTLLTLLLMSTGSVMAQGTQPSGSGTSGDPYQIATKDNFLWLSQNSSADWSAYYEQTANITFKAYETQVDWDGDPTATWDTKDQKSFSPIGNSTTNFNGSYDGKKKRISKQDLYGYFKINKEES
ncbi:MAG: hypothetical protein K9I47_11690 [Bacteroidales bacterium]|nr:hypothetical protein [Bacteroidales bacterium]